MNLYTELSECCTKQWVFVSHRNSTSINAPVVKPTIFAGSDAVVSKHLNNVVQQIHNIVSCQDVAYLLYNFRFIVQLLNNLYKFWWIRCADLLHNKFTTNRNNAVWVLLIVGASAASLDPVQSSASFARRWLQVQITVNSQSKSVRSTLWFTTGTCRKLETIGCATI